MIEPTWQSPDGRVRLYMGDCLDILPHLAGVDAVVTDPPYAEIDRDYGRLTEPQWHQLMNGVVVECRRLLSAFGSSVFILQANSERIGRTRPWLWEFMAKWSREWNMVQDAWWWNSTAAPTTHCNRRFGLMRPSVKACVWLGNPDCYRNQLAVLNPISDEARRQAASASNKLRYTPRGGGMRDKRVYDTVIERGGSTPFNLLKAGVAPSKDHGSSYGHGAATHAGVLDWWVRYLSADGGTVLDPFLGTGTAGVLAIRRGRRFIGIEKEPKYFDIAKRRIQETLDAEANRKDGTVQKRMFAECA